VPQDGVHRVKELPPANLDSSPDDTDKTRRLAKPCAHNEPLSAHQTESAVSIVHTSTSFARDITQSLRSGQTAIYLGRARRCDEDIPSSVKFCYIIYFGAKAPRGARASSFTRLLDDTQRRTTVSRTPQLVAENST
jgi:hypothetical protein